VKKNNKPQPCTTTSTTNTPKRVTLADIRRIKGYELLSDTEAGRILKSIRQFASVMADFIQKTYAHE
jgi:hypothetical protein